MLRKFLAWIVKNLIIILIATLIFSSAAFDFSSLMQDTLGDIYQYASKESQDNVIANLAEACSSLDKNENLVALRQLCANQSLLESMKEGCKEYERARAQGIRTENDAQLIENCRQLVSGEVEKQCSQLKEKGSMMPDFGRISASCKDFKSGKISDSDFFFSVISSSLPYGGAEMPKAGFLDKYRKFMTYLNNNLALYFFLLVILTAILYLIIRDRRLFMAEVVSICMGIGLIILLPYAGIIAYERFIGFDTTPILGAILGQGNLFDLKGLASVVLLMFLRTYNGFIITAGILFLVLGIIGKIYLRKSKSHSP